MSYPLFNYRAPMRYRPMTRPQPLMSLDPFAPIRNMYRPRQQRPPTPIIVQMPSQPKPTKPKTKAPKATPKKQSRKRKTKPAPPKLKPVYPEEHPFHGMDKTQMRAYKTRLCLALDAGSGITDADGTLNIKVLATAASTKSD